jgi:hypothetical protein
MIPDAVAAAAPLASSAWWLGADVGLGVALEPTAALAALFTTLNCDAALRRRLGFGDGRDAVIQSTRLGIRVATATAVAAIYGVTLTAVDPVGGAAATLRALAPFWLGVSLAGLAQQLVNAAPAATKRSLAWPAAYPKQHGTYGDYWFRADEHEQRMRDASSDDEKTQDVTYQDAKYQLESDADRLLKKLPWGKYFAPIEMKEPVLQKPLPMEGEVQQGPPT